jgi:hypothetical protein
MYMYAGTLAVEGGDGAGFAASFSVVGGTLDGVHITSHGSGYTYEGGLKVVISSGGVGCEGLLLRAALRSLRLNRNSSSIAISKVGKLPLEVAQGSDGPTYDVSVHVVSVSALAISSVTLLQGVALLGPPPRLSSFGVVNGSVTSRALSITWAPRLLLRLSLSLDDALTFFNHPASPLSANKTQQEVNSYVNALGVQEGLEAGATIIMRACPFDPSRVLGEQQRPDGCSFLQASLVCQLAGVTRMEARHVNSTSVSLKWYPPEAAPPGVHLVYAVEVAVEHSLPPTPYSPRFFRLGGAWEDLSTTSISFSLADMVLAGVLGQSLSQSNASTPAGTSGVSTTPPPPAATIDARVAELTQALGARARILGTLLPYATAIYSPACLLPRVPPLACPHLSLRLFCPALCSALLSRSSRLSGYQILRTRP